MARPAPLTLALFLVAIGIFCWPTLGGEQTWFDAKALQIFYPWKVLAAEGTRPHIINTGGVEQFIPWGTFLSRELFEHRQLPLWNPFDGTGMPFFGTAVKTELGLTRLAYVGSDLVTGTNLRVVLQLALAGIFCVVFLSRFVASPVAQLAGALVYVFSSRTLGQIYGVGNEMLVWLPLALYWLDRGITSGTLRAFAWGGVCYGLIYLGGADRYIPIYLVVGAACVAARVWALRIGETSHGRRQLAKGLGLAALIFLGISAIRLFPFVENYLASERVLGARPGFGSPDPSLINAYMPLGQALAIQVVEVARTVRSFFFVPDDIVFRRTFAYAGIIPWIMILGGLAWSRAGRTRSRVQPSESTTSQSCGVLRLSVGLSLLGLVIALAIPLLGWVLQRLNLTTLFNTYKSLTHVGDWNFFFFLLFPLATAVAFERVSTSLLTDPHRVRQAVWGTAAAAGMVVGLWLWGALELQHVGPEEAFRQSLFAAGTWGDTIRLAVMKLVAYTQVPLLIGILGGSAVVLFGLSRRWYAARTASWILVALLAMELLGVGGRFFRPSRAEDVYPALPSLTWLQEHAGTARVLSVFDPSPEMLSPTPHAPLLLPYEIYQVGFLEPITPRRHILFYSAIQRQAIAKTVSRAEGRTPAEGDSEMFYEQARFDHRVLSLPILNHLGVKFIVTSPDAPAIHDNRRYRMVYDGELRIYENLQVLPRALLVPRARVIDNDPQLLEAVLDAQFDPRVEVLLAEGAALEGPVGNSDATGSIQWVHEGTQRMELLVHAEHPSYLVLADSYHPGWRAEVDETPVPVRRANFLFRAVWIPAGTHQVVLTFLPRSFVLGAVVTGLTLLGLLVLFWRGRQVAWRGRFR